MSDEIFTERLREALAGEAGRHSAAPDLVLRYEEASQQRTRRRRSWRGASVVTLAVILAAAIVVIPAELHNAQRVESALASVFDQSSVQFDVSYSCVGCGASAWQLQTTIVNPSGGTVASGAGSDSIQAVISKDGQTAAELVEVDNAAYARIDLDAIGGSTYATNMTSSWASAATYNPDLSYLDQLAAGGWVDTTLADLDTYYANQNLHAPSSDEVSSVRQSFGLSFAQAWDAWSSLHQISTSGGLDEFAVTLPASKFFGSLIESTMGAFDRALPQLDGAMSNLIDSVGAESPSSEIDLKMWLDGDSLARLEVSVPTDQYYKLPIDARPVLTCCMSPPSTTTAPGVSTTVTAVLTPTNGSTTSSTSPPAIVCSPPVNAACGSPTLANPTLVINVSNPEITIAAPASVTHIDVSQLKSAFGQDGIISASCFTNWGGQIADPNLPLPLISPVNCGDSSFGHPNVGSTAESNLQTALTAAKTYYTEGDQSFLKLTNFQASNGLDSMDTALSFTIGSSRGPSQISVASGHSWVALAALSTTGTCFGIVDLVGQASSPVAGQVSAGGHFFTVINPPGGTCDYATLSMSGSLKSSSGFPG